MVCSALSDSNTSRKSSTMTDHPEQRQRSPKSMAKSSSPIPPPAVIIIDEEKSEDDESLSMSELRQEIEANSPNLLSKQRHQTPARASSSPQIPHEMSWTPLLHGRSIDRSSSSLYSKPTNFTSESEQQELLRQRSSSATSTTMFLEEEGKRKSPEKKSKYDSKHSFMALVRIKMFSMKRRTTGSNEGNSMT